MFAIYLLLNAVLLVVLASSSEESDAINPGFYLKVAKNVPRLGRRSDALLVPDAAHNDERLPNWFERVVTASKRDAGGAYHNVLPFDANLMFDLASSSTGGGIAHGAATAGEDLKFVSWRDFDIALESDTDLFEKLKQLAKSEAELGGRHQQVEFQQFVPLAHNFGGGTAYNDHMYYRINRAAKGDHPKQQQQAVEVNKERVEYQM